MVPRMVMKRSHVGFIVVVILSALALPGSVAAQARTVPPLELPVIHDFLSDGGFGKRHPDAPEELEQFGQLVGVWRAEQEMRCQDGGWTVVGPAIWTWRYALGGFAVQDLWYQAEAELPEYLGDLRRDYLLSAVRTYDVRSKAWKVAWMANGLGQAPGDDFGTMEAAWEEDRLVMRAPPNDYGLQRVTFMDITADTFLWLSEFSRDEGRTWQAIMKVRARRVR